MKKKISIALATMLSFACLPLNMSVNAEEFEYLSWCKGFNFENYKANCVVSGVLYNEDGKAVDYTVKPLTYDVRFGASDGLVQGLKLDNVEDGKELKIGDLFYVTDGWVLTQDSIPPVFVIMDHPMNYEEDSKLEMKYIGNGLDLWGDEFRKVLRNEVDLWMFTSSDFLENEHLSLDLSGLNIVKGDATEDEAVDILDVITVNKTILGKEVLQGYAEYVSDVNMNGEVDANDSLEIMKYVVGLTDTLDAE